MSGGDNTIKIPPGARGLLQGQLRQMLQQEDLRRLVLKPDQGKAIEVTCRSSCSNHFITTGRYCRFADWRFIHRARLGVVELNGTRRFNAGDRRCRRCGHNLETLPHVLNHCRMHSTAWKRRHNNIVDRLLRASRVTGTTIYQDQRVPLASSSLRPDITIIDEVSKTVVIVDVTIPFENRPRAFELAREEKLTKYGPLAAELEDQGFNVYLNALIVGSLGGWDPANEGVLRRLNISRQYARTMRQLMCSETIGWSRDIYVEHLTGTRQY